MKIAINSLKIALLIFQIASYSQTITGRVLDKNGASIPGVNVILNNTNKGSQTDMDGLYKITSGKGNFKITASFIGYKSVTKTVLVDNDKIINFTLIEDTQKLDDVVIKAKTQSQTIKEKPFAVASVKIKELKNLSTNANEVLTKISGINVRKTGGLGSAFTLSLNGLSGKKVKFFLDGVPLSNLGSSLSLDNFPVNLIDRIDVFKGVVPVYLGSDALGGAINIVTNQRKYNYLDASYGYGSFNTHTFSFLGQYKGEKTGFLAKVLSFYNYSDNSFKINNIDKTDDLGNITGVINGIERNHDGYQSAMVNVQTGFVNKKIADEILLGVTFSKNEKELQHSYDYKKPFGEAESSENLNQISLNYKKKNILKNIDFNLYSAVSRNLIQFKDTSSFVYSWTKPRKPNSQAENGELGKKRLSEIKDKVHFLNTTLKYNFENNNAIVFNYAKSFLKRTGNDKIPKIDIPFEVPHTVDKHVIGLSYDFNFNNKKWRNSIFVKNYSLEIKGREIDPFKKEDDPERITDIRNSFNRFGYGLATTYFVSNKVQIKASFESALRLPDGYEVFGDGILIVKNPKLKPEQSLNYNLGAILKTSLNDDLKLLFDTNLYYRDSENFIKTVSKVTKIAYENAYDAQVVGIESSLNLNYKDTWNLKANITKQNLTELSNGVKTKIPNRPLTFGNISLGYSLKNVFKNKLNLLLSTRFVDEYPWLSYTSGDSSRPTIPKQISQNFNVNYSFNQNKYNLSFSINNLFDSALYDNFNLQQPGRAFYFKMRYSI